jgi:cell division protein FtsN
MTKSTRPQRQETPRKKSGGGMLLGLFLGLVVGVLIAFGVVLYLNKAPLPFMNKVEGTPREPAKSAEPIALPGKPGDKVSEKPRFDFYGILEGKQPGSPDVAVGKPAPAQTPATPPEAVATKPAAKTGETYFLQAGAFQKAADADNLKAKLAMLGFEAGVQEADVPEKGKMHRVRVGPLNSAEEMNRVRTHMSQGGIQATVIKQ